jgi:hypothetical protein
MKTSYCILFAGVVGSSKTPIAHHLSCNLGLPIFSNDALRTEVKEDLLHLDQAEYVRRRDERSLRLIDSRKSFIYDASIDRDWERLKEWLERGPYDTFVISLDLTRSLLDTIYAAKEYTQAGRLPLLMEQHQQFLHSYSQDVNLQVTDKEFPNRLEFALQAVHDWLARQANRHNY